MALAESSHTNESSEPATLTMARFFTRQGDHADAEQWIKRALKTNSESDYVARSYASWLLDRGRFDEAAEQANRAVSLAPDDPKLQAVSRTIKNRVGRIRTSGSNTEGLARRLSGEL